MNNHTVISSAIAYQKDLLAREELRIRFFKERLNDEDITIDEIGEYTERIVRTRKKIELESEYLQYLIHLLK